MTDATYTAIDAVLAAAEPVGEVDRATYARQDRRFQHLLSKGIEPGPWIAVEHDLAVRTQVPSGVQRCDLSAELQAAGAVVELDSALRAVLAASVDINALEEMGVEVLEHDEERTVAIVCIEGVRVWPDALGGAPNGGEIERRFVIHARRAPWRDRAVRRFARLEIIAVSLHPDPDLSAL